MFFIDDIERFHHRVCRSRRAIGRDKQGERQAQTLRGLVCVDDRQQLLAQDGKHGSG